MTKKSFIMYHDICEVFEDLTDEQAGKIIKEIVKTSKELSQENPKEPTGLTGLLKAVFNPFYAHLSRDYESWKAIEKRNKENGSKGGRPKKKTQDNPKKPVKVNVKGNVSVNNINIPTYIDKDCFDNFLDMRKKIKAPMTDKGITLLLNKLEKFHQEGYDVNAVLDESVVNNWKGVFVSDDTPRAVPMSGVVLSDKVKQRAAELMELSKQGKLG